VTITNVLTDNLYNDLGFIANNKLMILVEAQSTWTVNILVRVLLYLAQSCHEYFQRTSQNYYKSRKVKMPKPELYVIFTGNKGQKPDKISLSKEFFEYKFCAAGNRTEFADYQLVLIDRIVIQNIILLKILWFFDKIIIHCIIANDDIGIADDAF